MLKNIAGRPVRGKEFYGRTRELEDAWQVLAHDNLLLLDARRVGKTSFMYRLEHDAPGHDLVPLYLTVDEVSTERGFVLALTHAVVNLEGQGLLDRLGQSAVGQLLGRIQGLNVSAVGAGLGVTLEPDDPLAQWDRVGAALLELLENGPPLLLLIDELPLFLMQILRSDEEDGRTRVHRFLRWLRKARMTCGHTRWVLAGSVGLDTVASLYNLSGTINDLQPLRLGAFSDKEANAFTAELLESHELTPGDQAIDHLLRKLGWPIPFFIQLVVSELRRLRKTEIDRDDMDQALERLLATSHTNHFAYWLERLEVGLGPTLAAAAEDVLTRCALSEAAVGRAELNEVLEQHFVEDRERKRHLRFLLTLLDNDGYLVQTEDGWTFRSGLLRDWWTAYHG